MPTLPKILIFIILVVLTSVFNLAAYCPGCTRASYGFPVALYTLPGCELTSIPPGCPGYEISYTGVAIDLVFWYLVSCGVVALVKKYKPTKK